jgi:hypothetical protein
MDFELASLNFDITSISNLAPHELAVARFHSEYDEDTMARDVLRNWRSKRDQRSMIESAASLVSGSKLLVHDHPTKEPESIDPNFVLINLKFDLPLNRREMRLNLTSSQLAVIPFHPDIKSSYSAVLEDAEVLFLHRSVSLNIPLTRLHLTLS